MDKRGVMGSSPRPHNKQDSRDIGLVILVGLLLIALVFTFKIHLILWILNILVILFLLYFIIKSQKELIKKSKKSKK